MDVLENIHPCVERIQWVGKPKPIADTNATWVVVLQGRKVHLFHQEADGELHALAPGCDCAKDHCDIEHIDPYLEVALATGKFHHLVIAGTEDALRTLRAVLGPALRSRTVAEVPLSTFTPGNIAPLKQVLQERLN